MGSRWGSFGLMSFWRGFLQTEQFLWPKSSANSHAAPKWFVLFLWKISSGTVGASEREVQINTLPFKQEDSLILPFCAETALASCLAPQSEWLKPHWQLNEFGNWNSGIILGSQITNSLLVLSWAQWLQSCSLGFLTQYSGSSSSELSLYRVLLKSRVDILLC